MYLPTMPHGRQTAGRLPPLIEGRMGGVDYLFVHLPSPLLGKEGNYI